MSNAEVTSRTISVEHVTITSSLTFADVRRRLEEGLPRQILEELSSGDEQKVKSYEQAGPALSIFLHRDHGVLLQIVGRRRNAIQYDIGNPLTASKMTRYCLAAALYPPLRVVLFENEDGKAVFEYDKPSSLFGQFGDDRVTEVGRYLDSALEAALRRAAG